jgi:hypothetical protein
MRRTRYARAYVRQPRGMNKTEAAYEAYLGGLKVAGTIQFYEYEAVTLRLGKDTRYTPDFLVIAADGTLELHEVKAGKMQPDGSVKPLTEDASRAKLMIAAEMFPFRFVRSSYCQGQWYSEVIA